MSFFQRKTIFAGMLALIVGYLTLVAGDVFLQYHFDPYLIAHKEAKVKMKQSGRKFDERSLLDALSDIRKKDPSYTLNSKPFYEEPIYFAGEKVFTFFNVPYSKTLTCNEPGYYVSFDHDRFGFNNPDHVWTTRQFDLALIGDSFVYGSCVETKDQLATVVRNQIAKTVNLAIGGSGPLIKLVSLREFLRQYKAKKVLWFFYEGNDLWDLDKESTQEILNRYLDDAHFHQNLFGISKEVAPYMLRRIEVYIERARRANTKFYGGRPKFLLRLQNGIVFTQIRELFMRIFFKQKYQPNYELFANVIKTAKEETERQGGEFHFVFLPAFERYVLNPLDAYNMYYYKKFRNLEEERRRVFDVVSKNNIPMINLDILFQKQADPKKMFMLQKSNHYSVEGYQKSAQFILQNLNTQ